MAKPNTLKEALSYDDIDLLPNFSNVESRRKDISLATKLSKNIELKYPICLSPMDSVSCVESCVALNLMGAAGILHRFMPLEQRVEKAREIKEKSGKCYVAVSLSDDIVSLHSFCTKSGIQFVDLFFLDIANGTMNTCFKWIETYKNYYLGMPDLITGNVLTMSSVLRHLYLKSDGIRAGIGIGSSCDTTKMTGVGCPGLTVNYYAWKARNQWLEETGNIEIPTILTDGGIRCPGDLVKAIASGADAVISGRIFAGCKETPGEVFDEWKLSNEHIETNRDKYITGFVVPKTIVKKVKLYRGMSSKSVQEEYGKTDGTPENTFVEGSESYVEYTGKSVCDIVHEYCNGLKSALSYFGFHTLEELKGAIWRDKVIAVRKTR